VAEHTIGVMIAMAKQLLEAERAARTGDFASRWRLSLTELRGKTLGIVGYGNIGRAIASRAQAFDMDVLRLPPRRPEAADELAVTVPDLHTLLAASDYVSVNLPRSPATIDFIGATELAAMRRGSFLVNTSRGGVVNEPALIDALSRGQLAGAAIDVFAQEPIDADDPLLSLPNVLPTPHYAGITHETIRRMAEGVAHEIADALARTAT
jgi:D-3-phosphoglycerate dehydrogenase